ncbi:MAG: SGNH/GDSL hydrolase family protein [Aquabacterium sp.]
MIFGERLWSRLRKACLTVAVLIPVANVALAETQALRQSEPQASPSDVGPLPLAVLGDSDSHGYQDTLRMPSGTHWRGGPFRAQTFQWTEVLTALRADQIHLGQRAVWGVHPRWARLRHLVGLSARTPAKLDHSHNFAQAGAECRDLIDGQIGQAPALAALMDEQPDVWRRGIVVIRIGINSLGQRDVLERLARDHRDGLVQAVIRDCLARIRQAVAVIRGHQPGTRFVLVGVLNNVDWPKYFEYWHRASDIANIERGLAAFDAELRQWSEADPRVAFFDDRSWFSRRWGNRGADGEVAYKSLRLGNGFQVVHGTGDDPGHSVLTDGHAGAVWNAMWAQSLVALINQRWGLAVRPISEGEIISLLRIAPSRAEAPRDQR